MTCPDCGGQRAIRLPTAHPQRPLWHLCPACNAHLLDEVGEWLVEPFWAWSDPEPRAPHPVEVARYAGGSSPLRWAEVPADWTCPACGRTKAEILRWTRHHDGRWRWAGGLCRHHDHGAPVGSPAAQSRAERAAWGPGPHPSPRFPATLICSGCNRADAALKHRLGLPARFSFAPEELRQIIRAVPNGAHALDLDVAQRLWEEHAHQTADVG